MNPASEEYSELCRKLILKFRTTTTLLHSLQPICSAISSECYDDVAEDMIYKGRAPENYHHQLRETNALATLLATDREVVAVTASYNPTGLQAVAAAGQFIAGENDPNTRNMVPSSSSEPLGETKPQVNKPCIISSSKQARGYGLVLTQRDDIVPTDVDLRDLVARNSHSFQAHASTLASLITECGVYDLDSRLNAVYRLRSYVIASSLRRVHRLITHPSLSRPFLDKLTSIRLDDITFEPMSLAPSPQLISLCSSWVIKTVLASADFDIPNMKQIAEHGDPETPIYTQHTYLEFHQLLCAVLKGRLKIIERIMASESEHGCAKRFEADIRKFLVYGYAVHNIVKSPVMAHHLSIIEPLLIREDWRDHDDDAHRTSADDMDTEHAESVQEEDTHLIAIQADACRPARSTFDRYMQWLNLQCLYEDAVNTVVRRVERFPLPVHITVASVQHEDTEMHPWEDLITDIFPSSKSLWIALAREGAVELLRELQKEQSAVREKLQVGRLDIPGRFQGALHGEVCLASLMRAPPASVKDRLEPTDDAKDDVLGVSQPCCAVCHELLRELSEQHLMSRAIHTLDGYHDRVYPCTLPPWLPLDILQSMVRHFQQRLRAALERIDDAGSIRPVVRRISGVPFETVDSGLSSADPHGAGGPEAPTTALHNAIVALERISDQNRPHRANTLATNSERLQGLIMYIVTAFVID